jgi:threonine dehydrogenase-like Zn-dependent dehydrogenase
MHPGTHLHSCSTAEFALIPFADKSLTIIPNDPRKDLDYVLCSDIFPTAWGGLAQSGFKPGDSVVVFGAGPVGLLVIYSAFLQGASTVFSVDHVQSRLDKAASLGAHPINLTKKGGPAKQILALSPEGVNRVVDACGYECVNTELKPDSNFIIREAIKVCGLFGGISLIGVYDSSPKDAGDPRANTIPNNFVFNAGDFWDKGITLRGGAILQPEWLPEILPLIASGRAKPSFVFSTEIGISEAQEGYKRFSEHKETKVAIRFPWEFESPSHSSKKRSAAEAVDDGDEEMDKPTVKGIG